MFFELKEAKETILEFSQETAKETINPFYNNLIYLI